MTPPQWLASRVTVQPSGCWTWTLKLTPKGYGRVRVGGSIQRAHRWAWERTRGPVPAGQQVLHRCDVRHCVRPDHLFLGTNADNQRDKAEKGRAAKGEANGGGRLTEASVHAIRAAFDGGGSLRTIAAAHGVASSMVWRIGHRVAWAHLPESSCTSS